MFIPKTYPLIPDEAFLLNPQPADMVRSKQRLIFQGAISYSEIENEKLGSFKNHLNKNKIVLDPYWTISLQLRFLQSCAYNFDKTVKDMNVYLDWIRKCHPLELTEKIERALKSGLIYFVGRDYKYRPVVVFDVKKTLDSKLPSQDIIDIYTYYLDFVVDNLLVEGHAQNWVIIVDLNNSGVFSTIGMLQKVLAAMSSRFKCRMHSCHLVRCPSAFSFLWGLAKKFLDQVTIQKISIASKNSPENLLTKCNHSQIEKKYGGAANDIVQYWPITIRSRVYDVQNLPISLLSVDEYKKLYKSQLLINQKINKNFINTIQKQIEKQRQNEKNKQSKDSKLKQIERQKEKQRSSLNSKFFPLESSPSENRYLKDPSKFSKNTIYELHQSPGPSLRQENSRISLQTVHTHKPSNNFQDQIQQEQTINQFNDFILNENKPLTFSSYAL